MLSIVTLTALWLRFKSYAYIAGGFAVWTLIVYAYAGTKAKMTERAKCQAAAIAFQLKQANTDLAITRATAIQVGTEVGRLTEVNAKLQEKVSAYETQVAGNPAKRTCVHDAGDVRSLRAITNRKAQQKRAN